MAQPEMMPPPGGRPPGGPPGIEPGTTMREDSWRRCSLASSIILSTASLTALGNFSKASWSVDASMGAVIGKGPI